MSAGNTTPTPRRLRAGSFPAVGSAPRTEHSQGHIQERRKIMDFALTTPEDYEDEDTYRRELLKRLFGDSVYLHWSGSDAPRSFHENGENKLRVGVALHALERYRHGDVSAAIRAGQFINGLRALKDRAKQVFNARSAPPIEYIQAALSYWIDRLETTTIEEAHARAVERGEFDD